MHCINNHINGISVLKKKISRKCNLTRHMRLHTGEINHNNATNVLKLSHRITPATSVHMRLNTGDKTKTMQPMC